MEVEPNRLSDELKTLQDLEGESDPRVRTLLWLARAFYGQDELDSYSGVFTEPLTLDSAAGARVDGLVNHETADELHHVLFVWIAGRARSNQIDRALELSAALTGRAEQVERELMHATLTQPLISELRPLRRSFESWAWRVAIISDRGWTRAEKERLDRADSTKLDRWTSDQLEELAAARLDPAWLQATTHVEVRESERLQTTAGNRRVFVAPVPGTTIAQWPGIENRRLFDLNVRFGLGTRNRVRQSLDAAFLEQKQEDFIASHNGLTVVCESVDATTDSLTIRNFSVVNGAQSVIALHENLAYLGPELQVLVKFVEVGPDDALASEIAVRSNTQNPVTGRNLRALDESQIRLRRDLSARGYLFNTRPDSSRRVVEHEIRNDDAAQWICAIYLERPWLAVKRTSLFAPETFQEIFAQTVSAEKVILLHTLRDEVQRARSKFPDDLRRAWLLTALTTMYLAGQLLRLDAADRALLFDPAEGSGDSAETRERLRQIVTAVLEFLSSRHERAKSESGWDNFRVDFKRQRTLIEMSSEVVRAARMRAREDNE